MAIFEELHERGLLVVDIGSGKRRATPIGKAVGRSILYPTAAIGPDAGPKDIDAALARLERQAARGGRAVGLAFPTPLVLERIIPWVQSLSNRSLRLAPVSAVLPPEPS